MDLYLLKKIVTTFVMPVNVVVLFLILAIIFHWKKPKASIFCLITATSLLLLATLPPTSDLFMHQLEKEYPVYSKKEEPVDYIVVLGCRHTDNPELPVTSQLGVCSLERMVEALRIYKLHPEAQVITSGYGTDDEDSHAERVKQALVLLGVPDQKVMTVKFPRNTEEEAQLISPLVQGTNVVLITNADHIQRAMKYFIAQGVHPIAAPTGYWVKTTNGEKNWGYYLPNSKKLDQTTIAWYESLGQVVQWVKTIF